MGEMTPDATVEPPARATAWVAVVTSPLVWVLGLAAFFDGISDNWVHAALLSAVAVAVARDTMLTRKGVTIPEPTAWLRLERRHRLALVLAGLAVLYAALAGTWTRYTWPFTVAILLPGIAVLLIGWRGALFPRARSTTRTSPAPWLVVLVLLALWELAALLSQPSLRTDSAQHPTISVLMNPVLASHLGRSVSLAVWLVVGWWILNRAPANPRRDELA